MHCDSKLWYSHANQSHRTSWLESKNSNQHLRNYICDKEKKKSYQFPRGKNHPEKGRKQQAEQQGPQNIKIRDDPRPKKLDGNTAIHSSSSTDTREDELERKRSTATRDPPQVSGSFRVESDRSPNRNHGNWNQYGAQKIAEKDEKSHLSPLPFSASAFMWSGCKDREAKPPSFSLILFHCIRIPTFLPAPQLVELFRSHKVTGRHRLGID